MAHRLDLAKHLIDREDMGEIRGAIKADVEATFRRLAMEKYGYCKGSLTKALEEAMDNWIAANEIGAAQA